MVVTPEIDRPGYAALKRSQPDCTAEVSALEAASESIDPATGCPLATSEQILDALYCYRRVWKHWENEYRVLDASLDAALAGGQEK